MTALGHPKDALGQRFLRDCSATLATQACKAGVIRKATTTRREGRTFSFVLDLFILCVGVFAHIACMCAVCAVPTYWEVSVPPRPGVTGDC